jgi:hypothetical protein
VSAYDPERYFATVNYCTAKGLFDHLSAMAGWLSCPVPFMEEDFDMQPLSHAK